MVFPNQVGFHARIIDKRLCIPVDFDHVLNDYPWAAEKEKGVQQVGPGAEVLLNDTAPGRFTGSLFLWQ